MLVKIIIHMELFYRAWMNQNVIIIDESVCTKIFESVSFADCNDFRSLEKRENIMNKIMIIERIEL